MPGVAVAFIRLSTLWAVDVVGQDVFLKAFTQVGHEDTCEDVPPDDIATCEQRKQWGGCDKPYMSGFCCQTCFDCASEACSDSPQPSPPAPPAPTPSASAIRLTVSGKQLLDPSGQEVRLTGFNWVPGSHPMKEGEGAFTKNLLPGANVARIVGVLWDNSRGSDDCMTDTAPYWKESCFEQLDYTIRQATDAQMWVILTARSLYGAGQEFQQNQNNVFYNQTLKNMMFTMWQHIAERYRSWDYIAAYEIMSEPRDKTCSKEMVHDFYEQACQAVHQVDASTPCMVGSSSYYKLWTFTDEIIISSNRNIIYTFDYFVPEHFGQSTVPDYPGTYLCKDLYPGWSSECCPQGANKNVTWNKAWSEANLKQWALPIREKYDVPIFINQWGVAHNLAEHGKYQFMADLAETMQAKNIGWTWWMWRGSGDTDFAGGSNAFVCKLDNGTEILDQPAFDAVKPYMR